VRLSIGSCASCKLAKNLNMDRLAHLVDQANVVNQAFGTGRRARLDVSASETPATPAAYSRRELFMALGGQQRSDTTSTVQSGDRPATPSEEPQPRESSPLPRHRVDLLAEEIAFLLATKGESAGLALPIKWPAATAQRCTFCGACVSVCPTGALKLRESVAAVDIAFIPTRCTGCMLCVEVCPECALTIRESTTAKDLTGPTAYPLRQRSQSSCPRCGRGTAVHGLCRDCTREQEVVDFFSNPRPALRAHR